MDDLAFWEKRLDVLRRKIAAFPAVNGGRRHQISGRYRDLFNAYRNVAGMVAEGRELRRRLGILL